MMAIHELGTPDNRLRRGRFNAGSGYLGPLLLVSAVVLAVLYMAFGDKLTVDFDIPSTSAPATPTKTIPATK